ncbi:MAG: coproporphyrinogen III oxidase family protein [Bacteroidales bacterium]|nr:coproporphyrinogen III oxidase family protein [Bacteroidales bacterium]
MIYVHVPFCKSFCTYCGFYSEVCKGSAQIADYVDEVCREISSRTAETAATASVNTLYFGGGTPSVLPLSALSRIVSAVRTGLVSQGCSPDFEEFTVEVNPEDIVEKGPEYVRGLRGLGVNRISMGVQSFDDGILRWMNRRHTAERARKAFGQLREGGFDNISIDLIFGLSQLSDDLWRSTLEQALELGPEHISSYQLSVEEGSTLERQVLEGRYAEASDEQCRRQYDLLCQALAAAGYHHYEISNLARPGFEARHNAA